MFAACGGGDDDDNGGNVADSGPTFDAADEVTPDAGDTQTCPDFVAPAGVIDSYPGTFSGDIAGSGSDFDIAQGVCTDERSFFAQVGEDTVVQLTGLTAGAAYSVSLDSPGDLSFSVTTGCTAVALEGECLLFSDQVEEGAEVADFVAPANGQAFILVDSFYDTKTLGDGSFTLSVVEPECTVDTDCADAGTPFCSAENVCVGCTNSVQCDDTAAPVCDVGTTNTCVAGFDECTGDDAAENADDGPTGATALAPAEGVPAVATGNICSAPAAETDHFSFTVAEGESRIFTLDWTDEADDLDLVLINSDGLGVANAFFDKPEVMIASDLPAGDYFVLVSKFESDSVPNAAAVGYTLTASLPECETSFDCVNPLAPVCDPSLSCVAGTEECTDDVDDDLADNDGPAGATTLVSGVASAAAVCNTPNAERDYFSVTLADTADLDVSIVFEDVAPNDLDVRVLNSEGIAMGLSFFLNPENVNLTFLPAGNYFVEVRYFGNAVTAALPYSVTATVTDNGDCATATDCAAEFSTQFYRGSCDVVTGACTDIEGAGALAEGASCDSPDDCTSGLCSNPLPFQENAQDSVCTIECVATADCASLAGFTCTVPFGAQNYCRPACVSNLDCGVPDLDSADLDTGEPWNYLTCTAGACDVDP
tara:strand:- start:11478 stop:13430 length:1953 start_codon:yes stop_codon:yes gene_type:complete